jgi:hypothetical protein
MADNKNDAGPGKNKARREGGSIGNRQNTTQTGAQNSGGRNRDQKEDSFTDDLRKSKERNSTGNER